MNSHWTTIPVGEALEKIDRQKKVMTSAYEDAGSIPIIDQGREYIAGFTSDPEQQYVGKLPLTIFGDHTRILKWVDRPFAVGADGTQLLRGDGRFDQRFFYYALKSVDLKHFGYERHFKYLKEKEIPLPDLHTQRKIAGILSAYDDLIENNLRRIKILEQMAQSLYREWFVYFRFPGHESARFVESPLGQIPKGWEAQPVGYFGKVITGKTPSKANADFFGEDVPFVKTPDMHGNMFLIDVNEKLSLDGAESQANKTLPIGSICVSCIGTIGVVCITTEECQTNQQINSIAMSDSKNLEFLYFRLLDAKQALENLGSNGATMGNVNKSKFESMEIVLPPMDLVGRYHEFVSPIFAEILVLTRCNKNLRQTRDLLLPQLLQSLT